jgi:hypothetical protein
MFCFAPLEKGGYGGFAFDFDLDLIQKSKSKSKSKSPSIPLFQRGRQKRNSRFPIPDSRFPIHDSRFTIHDVIVSATPHWPR